MADQKINLTVQVNTETGQLEVLGAKFKETGDKAKDAGKAFGGLSGEATDLLKSFLPFATAGGILAFFTGSIKAAEEENESLRRLQFTVESLNGSWDKNKDAVVDWAKAIQAATRFSDSDALTALERLARSTGSLTQGQKASKLAMDLAVASGQALSQTTEVVNGLVLGTARSVMMATREFGSFAGGATTAQGVLDSLSAKVSGASEKEKDLTKTTAQTAHVFEDFSKQIGQAFLPAVNGIVGAATAVVKTIETAGSAVAGFGATIFHMVEGIARDIIAVATGHYKQLAAINAETMAKLKNDNDSTLADVNRIWGLGQQQQTTVLLSGTKDRLAISKAAADKQKEDAAKAGLEMEQKEKERADKVYELNAQLEQKMAQLKQASLQTKRQALDAEYAAELTKIAKTARSSIEAEKLNDKLNAYHKQQVIQLANQELQIKQQLSFDIAGTAVQTLQAVNSLGNTGSENERTRAKALLALQQSLAIGWAWVGATKAAAETGNPTLAYTLAAAQTALIVAQFAQGVQNIDRAGAAEKQGLSSVPVSSPVGGIDTGQPIGGGGISVGGVSGGASAAAPIRQFVITFNGNIIIQGVADASQITPQLVDKVGEMLIDRINGQGQQALGG